MRSRLLVAIIASIAMSPSAFAADVYADAGYDWGGFYGGVSAGVSGYDSDAKVDYYDGANRGWSDNGMFTTDAVRSDFYETRRDPDFNNPSGPWGHDVNYPLGTGLGTPATGSLGGSTAPDIDNNTFNPITPWLSTLENDTLGAAGSMRLGANFQAGSFVFGAEADGSLLLNETESNLNISESASLSTAAAGGFGEPDVYGFTCEVSLELCVYKSTYEAEYAQDGEFDYRSSIDSLFTFRGRAGFAAGRALFFATGGLAMGQIQMSTSSHTSEQSEANWRGGVEVSGSPQTSDTDTGSSTEAADTSWEASDSKMAYGYAVGGGFSFAVTDNLIWTSDGYYYDLGSHSITAKDNYGDSSYTISQRFDGYVVRTGMEWKF